ncbi:hypothetical protein E1B28_006816 [Marasmius oreades]|uniref:Uncharacterized protein n=1 Tax=Marasmius oreades TaxID=181124 RepID=A0A9P7UWX1_9AGAR|nr:uncharacterized protein E1B28_006816 [Marasmius oreades]KAG7096143.1 hypothetical protein E1B28_006816 [Marasmius oreades]
MLGSTFLFSLCRSKTTFRNYAPVYKKKHSRLVKSQNVAQSSIKSPLQGRQVPAPCIQTFKIHLHLNASNFKLSSKSQVTSFKDHLFQVFKTSTPQPPESSKVGPGSNSSRPQRSMIQPSAVSHFGASGNQRDRLQQLYLDASATFNVFVSA